MKNNIKITLYHFLLCFVYVGLILFGSISSNCVKAKEDSNDITINIGTDIQFTLPNKSEMLYEQTLQNDVKFKDYVQGESTIPVIDFRKNSMNKISLINRSIGVASSIKVNGGYVHSFRVMHKNLFQSGGFSLVKGGTDGQIKNFWSTYFNVNSNNDVDNRITRFSSGSVVDRGNVYGLGYNDMNKRYMLYGVDPNVPSNSNNLWSSNKAIDVSSQIKTLHCPSVHEYIGLPKTKLDSDNSLTVATALSTPTGNISYLGSYIKFGVLSVTNGIARMDNVKQLNYKDFASVNRLFPKMSFKDGYRMVVPEDIRYLPNGDIIALINYSGNWTMSMNIVETIQVFSPQGTLKSIYYPSDVTSSNSTGQFQNNFVDYSSEDKYIFIDNKKESSIIKYDYKSQKFSIMNSFPAETTLTFTEIENKLFYFGSTPILNKGFFGFQPDGEGPYIVGGIMGAADEEIPFKVLSLITEPIGKNMDGQEASVIVNYVDVIDDKNIYVAGTTDSVNLGTIPRLSGLTDFSQSRYLMSFLGTSKVHIDYSPAIKSNLKPIMADLDFLRENPSKEEDILLKNSSGKCNVDVYDTIDNIKYGANWLENRVNKNPYDLNLPVDWQALGYDKEKIGPQIVTYFVTDSQLQSSATSRWVNNYDKHTSYDDEKNVFVRGENFTISIKETAGLTPSSIKQRAKTQAWLGAPENEENRFTEDMTKAPFRESDKVTFNEEQLKAIQSATQKEGAKPYPLDVTYTDTIDGTERSATHRIWIFVTDDSTVIQDDLILYAQDFTTTSESVENLDNNQINELIIQKSHAQAWLISDGSEINPIQVTKTDLTSQAQTGQYFATLHTEKGSLSVDKEISITILSSGELALSVPESLEFKDVALPMMQTSKEVPRKQSDWMIQVKDTRSKREKWSIQARLTKDFHQNRLENPKKITNILIFKNPQTGETSRFVTGETGESAAVDIYDQTIAPFPDNKQIKWKADAGFLLDLEQNQINQIEKGAYEAEMTFTFADVE